MSVIVRMEHCRQLAYCARGTKTFFEKHNLDFADFLKNGIDSEVFLEATNHDWMVQKVVEVASEQG